MAPVAERAVHRDAHDCDDVRRNRRAGAKIKVNLLHDYQTQAGAIAAAETATVFCGLSCLYSSSFGPLDRTWSESAEQPRQEDDRRQQAER